jgi:hypothetical protein
MNHTEPSGPRGSGFAGPVGSPLEGRRRSRYGVVHQSAVILPASMTFFQRANSAAW